MYAYNWQTGEYENNDGDVVSWSEVQANNYEEPEKKKDKKDKKNKIAIDPGHGAHHDENSQIDPGAVNGTDYEKDIALSISNKVTSVLKEKGYIVVQTRTGDVEGAGEKLQWRVTKAEGNDIFVSIHLNSNANSSANGFEVYYKPGDNSSKSLAQSIQDKNTLLRSRGIKSANYKVLRNFGGTAVLVEVGFISNANDLRIIKANIDKIGTQIASGIIGYLGQ